ncbi:MAG TPA: helicase C-terminal domain-containing protein, partial [Acidimicrobiales bacterium]|nr:helicase C-terminal domain-containing protein [Acidimicrobiales bacterium]
RAATLLAQGAGRLIRSAEDRGVVAVLDSRLATANYRKAILEALPPMKRTIDIGEVRQFLKAP